MKRVCTGMTSFLKSTAGMAMSFATNGEKEREQKCSSSKECGSFQELLGNDVS